MRVPKTGELRRYLLISHILSGVFNADFISCGLTRISLLKMYGLEYTVIIAIGAESPCAIISVFL